MKKISILLLGALGIFATSCEEKIEPSIPQQNPQEPILTANDVAVTASGFVSSAETLVLSNDLTDNLPFLTIGETKDIPEGSVVTANLQISTTEDFADYTIIDGTTVDNVVYVEAADLVNFQKEKFGLDPAAVTIYYRVPVYVKMNDVAYRLGGDDMFYAKGQYKESYDPGYVIPDEWYFVCGAQKVKLTHSAASVYNDYKFYLDPTELPENALWHVEAGGVTYGPKVDKSEEMSAVLTKNTNNVLFPVGSKYAITFKLLVEETGIVGVDYEAEDVSATPGCPAGIYILGGMNGWSVESAYEFVETDEPGHYALLGVSIAAGVEFKVADANWGPINYGLSETLVPGQWIEMVHSGGNISLAENFYGNVYFSYVSGVAKIRLESMGEATPGEAVDIYLKGGMNGWGNDAAYQFFTTEVANVYETKDVTIPAGTEFKVADSNWGPINLGASSIAFNASYQYELVNGSNGNLLMNEDFTGKAKLININGTYYVRFF